MESSKKKKPKNKSTNLKVTIETQNEEPGKLAPFVGYFSSGFDPTRKPNNPPPSIKVYRNQKRPKRLELVVNPSGSNIDFVGTNYSGEARAGRMCSYALGVLDKVSHKLKIVPIASNQIFRLEPRVRTADRPDEEPETPAAAQLTEAEKTGILLNQFSTTSASRRVKKKQLLTQTGDANSQQGLNEAVQETAIDKKALISEIAETSRNIPPHDLSATTPEKAYPLEKIILKGEWDYLKDIYELLRAGKDINTDGHPSFVCNRVYKLEVIQDEAEKRRVAGILSYISHLVNFKDQHSLDGKSSSQHHRSPSMLFQKFRKMFVDNEKNRLSDEKIGLLISHVLVLTLFIDEFETDFIDIARDLKMPASSLRPYFESLGCKLRSRNNVAVATLSVPLSFPTLRKRRKRG